MDAIDAALVDFSGKQLKLIHYIQTPIEHTVQSELKSINKNSSLDIVSRLDVILGRLFANSALQLIRDSKVEKKAIHAIGCHGQTILHRPEPPTPSSLQIGDPNIITQTTGIPTVADFRRMDMAAGGQGAPLAPLFHRYVFQHSSQHRVIVNIGGMANISLLPAGDGETVTGFDTGPGNVLLDEWIARHTGQAMDKSGEWAAAGNAHPDLVQHLLADAYFGLTPPKSTGKDYFNLEWLTNKLAGFNQKLDPRDVQASILELTAITIADSIKHHCPGKGNVIVCGGGAHNTKLMHALQQQLPGYMVDTSWKYGIDPDAVEAATFAWLAKCRMEKIPVNLPPITGAKSDCVLGALYLPPINS